MGQKRGKRARIDPSAKSASPDLPAFVARPSDERAYYGFPLVEESEIDGWVFGAITEYEDEGGCKWGDAFVVAPDGTSAGIIWQVNESGDHSLEPEEVCPPDESRWGVYGFSYPKLIRTTEDFVKMCHSFLPALQKRWQQHNRD